MASRSEFSKETKLYALTRQHNKCASCGSGIVALGLKGRPSHKYGESSEAHHMLHCQLGGLNTKDNCVVLCKTCHYSVHNGGHYRNKSPLLISYKKDYPFFNG